RSAALIAESFVDAQQVLLDRVVGVIATYPDPSDTVGLKAAVAPLLQRTSGARRVWVTTADGRRVLDVGSGDPRLIDSVDHVRAGSHMMINFIRSAAGQAVPGGIIVILRSPAFDTVESKNSAPVSRKELG